MERQIIEIDEDLCNGCGLCIPGCHEGALKIIDGKARLVGDTLCDGLGACLGDCPQGALRVVKREAEAFREEHTLQQWPVQWNLVPVQAPFLDEADLLLCADCVPFAYADFHQKLLAGRVLLVGCPKFDNVTAYTEKLLRIFETRTIRSVTVAKMEVPCCSGIAGLTKRALAASGKVIPYAEITISVEGRVLPQF